MARKFLIVLVLFALLVAGGFGYRSIRNRTVARRAAELGVLLEEEIREWEARDRSRPPLFEPAVEGTAWEHYREAWRLHEELEESFYDVEDWSEVSNARYEWPGLPAPYPEAAIPWLEHFEPVLSAVRRGACTSDAGVATDLREGAVTKDRDAVPEPFNVYICIGEFEDVLEGRAAACLEAGDAHEAISWLLVSARLSDDLVGSATSLDGSMGLLRAGETRATLARLVGGGLLPPEEVERVAGLPPPRTLGWDSVDATNLAGQMDLMRMAQGHEGWLRNPLRESTWHEEFVYSVLEPGRGEALDAWRRLREQYPVWRETWPGEDDSSFRKAMDGIAWTMEGSTIAWQMFAGGIQSTLRLNLNMRGHAEEPHEMLQLNIALFRYRQKEGRDPESIKAIRPAGIRQTTSLGVWDWREHESAPRRWIDRGTLADEAMREAQFRQAAGKFIESTDLLK